MEDKKEQLFNNIKLNIAISEFRKEYNMKDIAKRKKLSLNRVAVIIIVVLIIIVGGVQSKNIIQNFTDKNPVYIINSISEAITNDYVENLNMEYIYSDGVGLKINSFSMSENDINIILDFKLNDKTRLNGENLEYGYILYNENNEVYRVERGTNTNLIKEFIKKNNVKLDDIEQHLISGQSTYITRTDDNIVISSLMSAKDYFPKAKKLYIKVVGIGYKNENGKYKALSNSEWNIELDIPEKFYSESVIEYKLKDKINGVNLEKLFISDTSTTFIATIENFNVINNYNNSISIIDENGKEYITKGYSFDGVNKDRIICQFSINKTMVTNKMYLKINLNGTEHIIELIQINN